MDFAGIKVPDTALVHDCAMDLSRSLLEPFLFNHVMRSWLFRNRPRPQKRRSGRTGR